MFFKVLLTIYLALFFSVPQALQAAEIFQTEQKEARKVSEDSGKQRRITFEKTIVVLDRDPLHQMNSQIQSSPDNGAGTTQILTPTKGNALQTGEARPASDNTVSEAHEERNSPRNAPNIVPYKPDGWDNIIVISDKTDTHTDDILNAGETAYIDWAYINSGDADISETFSIRLYIDGAMAEAASEGLAHGYYGIVQDFKHTFSQAGSHTLKLVCDEDDDVAESDENDNEYERDTMIMSTVGASPNLTPYQPNDWDDKIVVSAKPGTHTEDTLYAGNTGYIDLAYDNSGSADIDGSFYVDFYINGEKISQGQSNGLKLGYYGYNSDIEYLFSQAGTYTLKVVCDADNSVAESDENDNEYEKSKSISGASKLNVSPFQPDGWDDVIVVSHARNTNISDGDVYAGETVYIDYAYRNSGEGDIGKFYVELHINGIKVRRAYTEGINDGYYGHALDFEYIFPSAGTYTLKVVCDADDDIPESDEMDNMYERSITVSGSSSSIPNLEPFKPDDWDDKIVVSNKSGTHTSDSVYAGETGYIDVAYINSGNADINGLFYADIYINDDHVARSPLNALSMGQYVYNSDFKYLFSQAGTYTLKLICDAEKNISESDETDNEYQRIITISSGGEPDIRIEPLTLTFDTQTASKRSEIRERPVQVLEDRSIHFLRGVIHPEDTQFTRSDVPEGKKRHILVQFDHLPSAEEQAELAEQGILLLGYIPNNTYWASVRTSAEPEKRGETKIAGGIQWAWTPPPEYKMSERIDKNEFPLNARYADGTVRVHVLIFEDVSKTEAIDAIGSAGSNVQFLNWITKKIAAVRTPLTVSADIAALDQVAWVEPASPSKIPFNETAAQRIKAEALRNAPLNLDGNDVTVGVWDNGAVFAHTDFGNRLTIVDHAEADEHATHVAGSVAGSGIGDSMAKGMAPAALIRSYDWDNAETEMRQAAASVPISNHSYGFITGWYRDSEDRLWKEDDSGFGQYSATAQDWDEIVYDTGMLIFKAAGNDRNDGPDCPNGPECDGPYDCIPQQGVSKNIIAVGATNDTDGMTEFSSWGPANDGRVKPDLCANGYSIRSTMPNGGYGIMSGTSMASPVAAGTGAILFQHFKNITGNAPKPETLKALMIHGAEDLGRIGPDYEFGWGLINAEETADLITQRAWQTGAVSTGTVQTYPITVSENTAELKATLVWTDYAAEPLATICLANDLDMVLIDPNGIEYKPWILDGTNPTANAVRGVNHLDNVEQVVVTNPIAGEWTVSISGYAVPKNPPQNFTVTAEGIRSDYKTFTIYNDGTDLLNIESIEKEGGAEWMSYQPASSFSIEPGKSQTIAVTATPGAGTGTDRLLIYSDDSDKSPYPVGITLRNSDELNAADDSVTTIVDTPVTISVLENDSAPAGRSLTVTAVSDPSNGNASVSDGNQAVLYTPAGGFTGEDSFTYTVNDGTQETTASVAVTVERQAATLTAADDEARTLTNTSVTIYVLGNDSGPAVDRIAVMDVSDPDHGDAQVNADNKTVLYTPASNFTGEDAFSYTMSYGLETAQANVSVTVESPVIPLAATDDTAHAAMNMPVIIRVLENDTGPGTLTVTGVSAPSHGSVGVNADNQTVLFTPAAGFTGEDTFTYTMSNGTETASASVTVTVAVSDEECAVYASSDTPLNIPDNSVSGVLSTLMLTPGGEVRDVNVTMTIKHPWTDDLNASLISPGGKAISLFEKGDGEGENFISTTLDDEAVQKIRAASAPFTGYYQPASPLSLLDGISPTGEWKLQVADGEESDEGILNSWELTLCYIPSSENRPPTIKGDTEVSALNSSVSIDVLVNDSDLDGDPLTITGISDPLHGDAVINADKGDIIYTPEIGFAGTDRFTYTVADGNGGTSTAGVRITVYSGENLIQDGGFEAGAPSPKWNDVSELFSANVYQEKEMARSGDWLSWFEGGDYGSETASVAQEVMIPEAEKATLRFCIRKYLDDVSGTLMVRLDNQVILSMTDETAAYSEWTEEVADVSSFADGNTHQLRFDASIQFGVGATSFLVDDVSLIAHKSGEGPVTLSHVIAALQILAGMNPGSVDLSADINGDGRIGNEEVVYWLGVIAGVN